MSWTSERNSEPMNIRGVDRYGETTALLAERGKTHGRFEDNARVAQDLKVVFRAQEGWGNLSLVHREALDMFAGKVSRILSGQGGFADHWDDIAGYAKLAANGGQP